MSGTHVGYAATDVRYAVAHSLRNVGYAATHALRVVRRERELYGLRQHPPLVGNPMLLRARYVVSGTDIG
eukprot:2984000-Rhodomonas_salina.1